MENVRRKNRDNKFEVGNKVKIGFMLLTCVAPLPAVQNVGDLNDPAYIKTPNGWSLISDKGALYHFYPHEGLSRVG